MANQYRDSFVIKFNRMHCFSDDEIDRSRREHLLKNLKELMKGSMYVQGAENNCTIEEVPLKDNQTPIQNPNKKRKLDELQEEIDRLTVDAADFIEKSYIDQIRFVKRGRDALAFDYQLYSDKIQKVLEERGFEVTAPILIENTPDHVPYTQYTGCFYVRLLKQN